MTKWELIERIAADAGITKLAAERAINAFQAQVTRVIRRGDKLTLTGFGTFEAARRAARKGRDPQSGATISIAATRVPRFRAGKELKEAVR
jgi:DNA-binding protein HU-beta